ncbi:MAG: L,D-transpeptidase family protein [Gammaproteobacteria bacterium]|jgi:L,D-transpeptidase ErfK/SrfK|nr:L,D-transpeptidase family protein [Gammaproteobacteria bacterium]
MSIRYRAVLAMVLAAAAAVDLRAAVYPMPAPGDSVVGEITTEPGDPQDTLSDVARRHNLGWDAIRHANPDIDAWMTPKGATVVLPTQFVLPATPREGIVLNLAEMRVYYYPPAKAGQPREVVTYPASIGRMDWRTPLGATRIVRKQKNPVWNPPASIKREHAEKGDILPDSVPPGEDNPLGEYAMYLGHSGYLIHGTNRPYGIGMRVTHGCVRLYPEDVEDLFNRVPVGTKVVIVDEPFKAGWLGDTLYLEAHPKFNEEETEQRTDISPVRQVVMDAVKGQPATEIDWSEIELIARENAGVPIATSVKRRTSPEAVPARAPAETPAPRPGAVPPSSQRGYPMPAPTQSPAGRSLWQLDPWGPGQAPRPAR